jgi:hypothetical protein
MKLFIMQFSLFACHLISSVQISSSPPCFQTPPSLYSSLNVRDQISHPYRNTGKWLTNLNASQSWFVKRGWSREGNNLLTFFGCTKFVASSMPTVQCPVHKIKPFEPVLCDTSLFQVS